MEVHSLLPPTRQFLPASGSELRAGARAPPARQPPIVEPGGFGGQPETTRLAIISCGEHFANLPTLRSFSATSQQCAPGII